MKPPSWHKQHKKRSYPRQKNYEGYEPKLPGQNYHHVLPQSQYTTKEEHKLSRHKGLVIPEFIPVHDYLTKVVPFPPKFLQNEIPDAVDFLDQSDEYDHKQNRFWGVEAIMRYTVFIEMDSKQHAERMHNIRWNLAQQIGIMAGQHTIENPLPNYQEIDQGDKAA